MFGLPYTQYVHGSALRTWNCVSRFAAVLWFKFNHLREPIVSRYVWYCDIHGRINRYYDNLVSVKQDPITHLEKNQHGRPLVA